MEENIKTVQNGEAPENDNFNDSLHGENLNDRVKVLSPGATVAKRFFRSKLSMIGLITLIVLFLICFIGPLFSPWGEKEPDEDVNYIEPSVSTTTVTYYDDAGESYSAYVIMVNYDKTVNTNAGISWRHWMGTDENGYDVFTRLMCGGRVSLTIGFVVVFIEIFIGMIMGGLAGYFGGWVDNVIMRLCDVLNCIPSIPIMLILSLVFTNITSIAKLYYIMLILALIGWGGTARLVRGQILTLREQEFMLAAKCSGLSTFSKIFKHLLPNVMPQIIVSATLGLGNVILSEATLGYLGLGAPLGTATWGTMINASSKMANLQYYPNLWLGAGICITLAILAFNFVGDGLRDAFDPKMKR